MYNCTSTSSLPIDAVIHGDCIEAMRRLPTGSIDFILTDPPYLFDAWLSLP